MIKPFYYYVFRIKDGLFIGNKRASDDIKFHYYTQITTIINCAALEIKINNPLIHSINFEWIDSEDQIIVVKKDLELVFNIIEEKNKKGESVLVCCSTGQSRSVTLVAAYLMKRFQWNLKTSLQFLQICRKDFEIRQSFLYQLSQYERELLQKKNLDKALQKQFIEEEKLLKNTFFNAQSQEFNNLSYNYEQLNYLHKRSKKKNSKKVSWAFNLITIIRNFEEQVLIEKNQSIKLSILISNTNYLLCGRSNKLNKVSQYNRNKTPDPVYDNWEMPPIKEKRSTSVINQQQQNRDQPMKSKYCRNEQLKRSIQRTIQLKLK